MSEALAIRETDSAALMPVMSIHEATERYKTIVEYVKNLMHEGSDFGKIPGTDKNTLLKPGAEKLCTLFGLSKRFQLVEHIEDWAGTQFGEPFFNYLYRCALYRGDALIAEGDGSCNSRESKYRWRQGERLCPGCGKGTIIKGREEYGGGWLCFAKKGGCGAKFNDIDERITGQQVGRVPNPDIADQVNTLQKMAQKRALIAATLLAVNASEFFTQDMEDFIDITAAPEASAKEEAKPTKRKAPTAGSVRKTMVQAVADAFKMLNKAGEEPPWTPKLADAFVAERFQGAAGVDHLDDGQLSDLLKLLSGRLDLMKGGTPSDDGPAASYMVKRSDIIAVIRSYWDGAKEETDYLAQHYAAEVAQGLASLEGLNLTELEAIKKDVEIPF